MVVNIYSFPFSPFLNVEPYIFFEKFFSFLQYIDFQSNKNNPRARAFTLILEPFFDSSEKKIFGGLETLCYCWIEPERETAPINRRGKQKQKIYSKPPGFGGIKLRSSYLDSKPFIEPSPSPPPRISLFRGNGMSDW